MKTMLAALAGASLLATSLSAIPAPAAAQHRGGGGVHVGARGAVVVHPHYRGGYHGGYYRGWGYHGRPGYWGGAALGFALGASLAYPWYYGAPAYYGYYPAYGYYGGYVASEPSTYPGDPWSYDYGSSSAPPPAPEGQAPSAAEPQPQACGSWSWNAAESKYDWVPCQPSGG